MRSNLRLVLLALLVLLAISAVMADQEESGVSEDLAETLRVARSPEARKRRRGRKGKRKNKGKGKGRKAKGKKGKMGNRRRRKNKQKNNSDYKKKKQGGARNSKKQQGRSTVSGTCFQNAVYYMKIWKDYVGNFERQRKRMEKQNSTGGNKSGKKGLFAPAAHRLVDIGGGNKTNMSCGGQYGNKGADQLQNLTKTLFDCEKDVNTSCNPANFPQPNLTFINNCKKLMENFTTEATYCLGKTLGSNKTNNSDACNCWDSPVLNMTVTKLKNCKASNASKAITAALKNCTSAFQTCRKFEDDVSAAIATCASDSSKLKKKAANLAKNNASMTAAKLKIAKWTFPNITSRTAANCSEVISISQKIVKIANSFPQSPMIATYAKKISDANVTCNTAEIELLKTEVTSLESAIVSVNVVLTAIQEQIKILTGSTASTAQLDAINAGTSTKAPAGRRNRILKAMMSKF